MSEVKVKLCGLRRAEDIAFANEAKPDYIGFVFAPKSCRAVTAVEAKPCGNSSAPESYRWECLSTSRWSWWRSC